MEITKDEIEVMFEVLKNWQAVSMDPDNTRCMSDHCHMEYDQLFDLARRLEKEYNKNAN